MAWTAPATWVDGSTPSAADFNAHIRDNLRYLKGLDGVPYIEAALELPEAAAPATPASGRARVYPKSNGRFYSLDDAGVEYEVSRRSIGARVRRTTAQSLTTGVAAAISFDSERYDTSAIHDLVTNPTRLTIPLAGRYAITANANFAANATGVRSIDIYLNGVTVIASQLQVPATGIITIVNAATMYEFAAADYIEMFCFQNSGGALNVGAAGNYSPELALEYVGPV